MARLPSSRLGDDLHALLLFHWLDVRSLVTLDIAVSSDLLRPHWMTLLRSPRAASIDKIDHSASSLIWLIQRGICTTRIQMKVNAWRVPECDPSLLNSSSKAERTNESKKERTHNNIAFTFPHNLQILLNNISTDLSGKLSRFFC